MFRRLIRRSAPAASELRQAVAQTQHAQTQLREQISTTVGPFVIRRRDQSHPDVEIEQDDAERHSGESREHHQLTDPELLIHKDDIAKHQINRFLLELTATCKSVINPLRGFLYYLPKGNFGKCRNLLSKMRDSIQEEKSTLIEAKTQHEQLRTEIFQLVNDSQNSLTSHDSKWDRVYSFVRKLAPLALSVLTGVFIFHTLAYTGLSAFALLGTGIATYGAYGFSEKTVTPQIVAWLKDYQNSTREDQLKIHRDLEEKMKTVVSQLETRIIMLNELETLIEFCERDISDPVEIYEDILENHSNQSTHISEEHNEENNLVLDTSSLEVNNVQEESPQNVEHRETNGLVANEDETCSFVSASSFDDYPYDDNEYTYLAGSLGECLNSWEKLKEACDYWTRELRRSS